MGLFWWYGQQIGTRNYSQAQPRDSACCLRALLLLGICYLTNF
jgi:hypothetical protein